ncbi:uncharacterized protein LOC117168976 [Belonocnema kinseyi]|uniref:uncharacterized protein LOC117168976 n=1 Tax=Belonocnema kinseyi TaxID=2817044 RepID=UPI00143CED9D|nr:uncharacterized protein LOC117168976 [Belonocnema kinseyi]
MADTSSIMTKIHQVEGILKDSWHRVDIIQRKLNTKLMTIEDRERLEIELQDVQDVLKKNEDTLKSLRRQNSKSCMVAASLVFVCFLLFGIYSVFFGKV